MYDCGVVDVGEHSFEVSFQLEGEGRIGFCPFVVFAAAVCYNLAQLFASVIIEFLGFGEYLPGVLGVASEVAYCGGVVGTALAQGLAVGRTLAFEILDRKSVV